SELRCERRRRLMGALQRRDVDGVDPLMPEPLADQPRLLLADRIERRVGVTVTHRSFDAFNRGCGLAVPDQQDDGRARRWRVPVLPKPRWLLAHSLTVCGRGRRIVTASRGLITE